MSIVCQENNLLTTVQDTGPGIATADMPRIFGMFQQLHPSATREAGGTGLGLAISKQLIELHGGEIWAESREGEGTTLRFTLPLPLSPDEKHDLARTASPKHKVPPSESCLVIHADPVIVRSLARYMEGYHVLGLPDEHEMLRLITDIHPRAIITTPDRVAPIEAALSDRFADVPIISCLLPDAANQATVDGVLSYLIKPVMPEALLTIIRGIERNGETTILLVDDEPDAVRLLERILLTLPRPYRVLKAYSGIQALEIMRHTTPDIVLMDLAMPEMNGVETIAQMRARTELFSVPVVIVSAHDWLEDKAILRTPLVLYARKPISLDTGAKCLQALLDAFAADYEPISTSAAK